MAYNLLQGKKGIIFGELNDKSIAWRAAIRAHEEGAGLVLTNTPIAMRMGGWSHTRGRAQGSLLRRCSHRS